MKQNKGHDYSEVLIWAAALVTVVRYAAAFIASDATEINSTLSEIITIAMGISGLGMGVLDVIGGTYLFTGWQKKMPANGQAWSFKFKVLTFFAIGLIVNGILILIPFTASRVSGNTMFHVLGNGFFLYAWSAVVNIAPYLLVGGVAVGNTLVTIETTGQTSGQSPVKNGQNSDNQQTAQLTKKRRNELTPQDLTAIASMSSAQICEQYGCDERTARRWRQDAQKPPAPFP